MDSFIHLSNNPGKAPVVPKVDSAIYRINHNLVDSVVCFVTLIRWIALSGLRTTWTRCTARGCSKQLQFIYLFIYFNYLFIYLMNSSLRVRTRVRG